MKYDPDKLKPVLIDLAQKRASGDPESKKLYAAFLDSPDDSVRELAGDILYRHLHNLPYDDPGSSTAKKHDADSVSKPRNSRSRARTNSKKKEPENNNSSGKSDDGKDTSKNPVSDTGCCVSFILSAAVMTGLAYSVHLTWWSLLALIPALGGAFFVLCFISEFGSRKYRSGFEFLFVSLALFAVTYIWLVCGFWTCLWATPVVLILGLILSILCAIFSPDGESEKKDS